MATYNEIKRELAKRELARRNLSDFILYTYPGYEMGKFHKYLCDIIDKFIDDINDGKTPRLIVTAPPRSGKSEILSRRLPAYLLGKYPDFQIINTSYSADLASKMNLDVQKIIDDQLFKNVFPEIILPKRGSGLKRDSETFEVIGGKGGLRSAGVGGGITGMGAHLFLIDDPVKDAKEASSPTIQQNIVEWFNTTAYTRLMPKNGLIIIMTRWHLNDLVGYLLDQQNTADFKGKKFELINFPAIAEEDEYITLDGSHELFRKKGEALHPERYSLENVLETRALIGDYAFNALYQQHPVPSGGNIYRQEWFKFYNNMNTPMFDRLAVSWDMSFKGNETSDYVVGQVWGKKDSSYYLIDEIRFQGGFVKAKEAVLEVHKKYPKAIATLIEDKANGSAIIEVLKQDVSGIIPITPNESKMARAEAVSPLFEAGNVYIPSPNECSWSREYMTELTNFPFAKNDDRVDATSQMLNYWQTRSIAIWGRLNG